MRLYKITITTTIRSREIKLPSSSLYSSMLINLFNSNLRQSHISSYLNIIICINIIKISFLVQKTLNKKASAW